MLFLSALEVEYKILHSNIGGREWRPFTANAHCAFMHQAPTDQSGLGSQQEDMLASVAVSAVCFGEIILMISRENASVVFRKRRVVG